MIDHNLLRVCQTCAALSPGELAVSEILIELIGSVLQNGCYPNGEAVGIWLSYDGNDISFGTSAFSKEADTILQQHNKQVIHILSDATAIAKRLARNYDEQRAFTACMQIIGSGGPNAYFGWIVAEMLCEHFIEIKSLANDSIQAFFTRMVNSTRGFYLQQANGSPYLSSYRPLTVKDIEDHLSGQTTIGFPGVDENGYCRWLCLDDDNILQPSEISHLDRLESYFKDLGFHVLREGTRPAENGLKQGHLWIFLSHPIPAKQARAWVFKITDRLGLGKNNSELAKNKLELFPKQDKPAKLGNPVRGPLGRHLKDGGNRGYFWGAPYKVCEQLNWFASQPLNDPSRIEAEGKLIIELNTGTELKQRSSANNGNNAFSNEHLDFARIFQILDPTCIEGQAYYICNCPKCGQRRAYFYKDTGQIKCNRILSCGYELSITKLKRLLNEQKAS